MKNIETIKNKDEVLAIIVRGDFNETGIHFFTPGDYSQQLAYMHHPTDHIIKPHVHNIVTRTVHKTNEVLVIKKGKLRCDFFDDDQNYLESIILQDGDIILLVSGGHGFKCLEEVEMYEIKQGPYAGDDDKIRFESNIEDNQLKFVTGE